MENKIICSNTSDETTALLSGESTEASNVITTKSHGSSWYASVFLVVNAALGAGLLNFPASYNQSGGLAVAITVQAVLLIFVFGSLVALTYCSDLQQSASYQDVVYSWCGKKAQVAAAVAVIFYAFGTCITFFIIIGDQWDKFLTFAYGSDYCHHWYMNRAFTMVVSSIILVLPMCYPSRIDFLKYISMLGVLAIVYCVILVTVKYFLLGETSRGTVKTSPDHWSDVFIVVPVICFGYQCHLSVIPIYSCMEKRNVKEFTKTLLVAIAICVFAYTVTASFGYLTFGDLVQPDVLLSYKPTPDVIVAAVLIAVKMYTTVPVLAFVGRVAVESLWIFFRKLSHNDIVRHEKRRRYITVTLWFFSSLIIAVLVPNIGVVISLLGGLAAIFAFVFPGLCLLQVLLKGYVNPVEEKIKYRLWLIMSCFCVVFGMFIFGLVSTQSIMEVIEVKKAKKQAICQ